jgi:hypothetical protein
VRPRLGLDRAAGRWRWRYPSSRSPSFRRTPLRRCATEPRGQFSVRGECVGEGVDRRLANGLECVERRREPPTPSSGQLDEKATMESVSRSRTRRGGWSPRCRARVARRPRRGAARRLYLIQLEEGRPGSGRCRLSMVQLEARDLLARRCALGGATDRLVGQEPRRDLKKTEAWHRSGARLDLVLDHRPEHLVAGADAEHRTPALAGGPERFMRRRARSHARSATVAFEPSDPSLK